MGVCMGYTVADLEAHDLIHTLQTSSVHIIFTTCAMKPFLQLQGLCKYNFYVRIICREPKNEYYISYMERG